MKKDIRITVLIVNYNTSDFIEASLFSLHRLSECDFHVLICDNGSKKKDKIKLKKLSKNYTNVELFFRQQSEHGSMGHGEALDFLIPKVSTPYTFILDADCIILLKNWDRIFIQMIKEKVPIIGTPPVKGQQKKPTDFPLMYAVLFKTDVFRQLGISMKPDNKKNGPVADTGYQMREKYLDAGYRAHVFFDKSTRHDPSGPFGRVCFCTEYYLADNIQIAACHFSRGASLGAAKYKSLKYRLPLTGRIFRYVKGTSDKRRWLAKCYDMASGFESESRSY